MLCSLVVGFAQLGMDCSGSGPESTPLARPRWVCPEADTTGLVGGIGPSSSDQAMHLKWTIGDDPDLVGYILHRRTSSDLIDKLYASIPLTREQLANRGRETEFVDQSVQREKTYYYVLFAYDADSTRSARSDTLGFMLVDKPVLYTPGVGARVTTSRPTFVFGRLKADDKVLSYVVRVDSGTTADHKTMWISSRGDLGFLVYEHAVVTYGVGGIIIRPALAPGVYRWRVGFQGFTRDPARAPCDCVYDTVRCPDADPTLPLPEDISSVGSLSEWRGFIVE